MLTDCGSLWTWGIVVVLTLSALSGILQSRALWINLREQCERAEDLAWSLDQIRNALAQREPRP